jgi:hypothetical protein
LKHTVGVAKSTLPTLLRSGYRLLDTGFQTNS